MARLIERLAAKDVRTLPGPGKHPDGRTKKAGKYHDGRGLYLVVGETGSRSWVLRYMLAGRSHEMGLGSAFDFSLAEARQRASDARKLAAGGDDPLSAKRVELKAKIAAIEADRIQAAGAMTFRDCGEAYQRAHSDGWKNAKHRQQWANTLSTYVYPVIGKLPVAEIDTPHIVRVLEPIWKAKRETASRVRGRIESILNWATAARARQGDNPARWSGHLEELLLKKKPKVEHHAALPYADMHGFLVELRGRNGIAAVALEFAILTAARTGEVIGATWAEIDFKGRLWTVLAERMKAGKEHRVPLSDRAIELLKDMARAGQEPDRFIFPGMKAGRGLSNMALLETLRRMDRGELTAHGFRSSFRDWARQCTNFPRDIAELALAHGNEDRVEAAYARGDALEKRRQLMAAWSRHCDTAPAEGAEVVPLHA
jgi:integrase